MEVPLIPALSILIQLAVACAAWRLTRVVGERGGARWVSIALVASAIGGCLALFEQTFSDVHSLHYLAATVMLAASVLLLTGIARLAPSLRSPKHSVHILPTEADGSDGKMHRLNEARLRVLLDLSLMSGKSFEEMMTFVLNEGVRLTESNVGFLGLMDESASACTMQFCSDGVRGPCAAGSEPLHAPIENAGIWADAVRNGRAAIVNDCRSCSSGGPRLPEDHIPIERMMSIPVVAGGRPVAVALVANKEEPYDASDARQLTLLMEGMWTIIERKREEETLRRSKEFSRTLLENVADCAFAKDVEGRYTLMNEACSDLFCIPVGSALGKTDWELHDEDTAKAFSESDRVVLDTGESLRSEVAIHKRDGAEAVFSVMKAPLRNGAGLVTGLVGICRDVTHQKLVEQALRESEERFRFIVEKTGDVIYRLRYDTMKYDYLNPAIKDLTGYSPEEINDIGFSSLVTRIEVPGVGIVSKGSIAERRLKGEIAEYRADYLILTKNGRLSWVRDHSFPWMDSLSALIGSVGVLSDVTEQKKAEDALRESEERYRMIFNHSPVGVMQFDMAGDIVDCNQMFLRILGSSRDAVVGFCMLKHLQNESVKRAVMCALSGEFGFYEGDYLSITGNKLASIRATFSPLTDKDGKIAGGVCVAEDITARTVAESALRESEKQLKHLSSQLLLAQETERKRVANEIHDSIGQTLYTIRAGIKTLIDQVEGGCDAPDAKSLWELNYILEFALEEVRNIYMNLRPSLLDDLGIRATIKWYLRKIQHSHPNVRIEENITIEEDEVPEQLKIIIFRIVQSAVENIAQHSYADSGRVQLHSTDGRIELIVEDNGTGFEPRNVLLGEAEANGLGLACMQERVESSGGLFTVKSGRKQGTTIRAWWPSKRVTGNG